MARPIHLCVECKKLCNCSFIPGVIEDDECQWCDACNLAQDERDANDPEFIAALRAALKDQVIVKVMGVGPNCMTLEVGGVYQGTTEVLHSVATITAIKDQRIYFQQQTPYDSKVFLHDMPQDFFAECYPEQLSVKEGTI